MELALQILNMGSHSPTPHCTSWLPVMNTRQSPGRLSGLPLKWLRSLSNLFLRISLHLQFSSKSPFTLHWHILSPKYRSLGHAYCSLKRNKKYAKELLATSYSTRNYDHRRIVRATTSSPYSHSKALLSLKVYYGDTNE